MTGLRLCYGGVASVLGGLFVVDCDVEGEVDVNMAGLLVVSVECIVDERCGE